MATSFLKQKIVGIPVWILLVLAVLVVGYYGHNHGWFDGGDTQTVIPDNGSKLKLERTLNSMNMTGTLNGEALRYSVANSDKNYNDESGVVAIQIDAEKSSNATHTTFTIKAQDLNGQTVVISTVTQPGVLSTPSSPVTAGVIVDVGLNAVSGFTNKNEILTSSVSVSAPVLKTANGTEYYPVVLKNSKPAVYVDGQLGGRTITWTYSDVSNSSVKVTFDLDWEGINQMTSISDEITVPIKITNTDDSNMTVRIIKNAAI